MTQAIPTPSPPSPPGAKRKVPVVTKVIIVIITIVIIIIATAGVSHFLITPESSSHSVLYHVGVPSESQISSLTNVTLIEHPAPDSNITGTNITTPTGNYSVIGAAFGYYLTNTSNTSSEPPSLGIMSVEFNNASAASSFYTYLYSEESSEAVNTTTHPINGTYDGFNYSTLFVEMNPSFPASGPYIFFAIGHAGQFLFAIVDENIPLTNTTALIHDQISAMESP